ncbi:hypothetical protein BHM03_00036156 [Ensete ventricosum]|nr:hypothetical protein BHM03_00036156 [Ensete ventricosum]
MAGRKGAAIAEGEGGSTAIEMRQVFWRMVVQVEECRPSYSLEGQFGSPSSSSSVMTRADVKALQALEAMKLCHDFDSTMSVKSLATIRKRYSIPTEYEIPSEEATRKMPEVSGKHPIEAPSGQWKKAKVLGRHKSRHEGEKSKSRATKGKKPTTSIEETPTPRVRSKSVKELSTHPGEDGRDYHVIRVSSRPEHAPDAPLEVHLSQLTHIMWIWQDGEASANHHYFMALFDRVHDFGRVIIALDNKSDVLRKEVQKLKAGGDPDTVVVVEQWGSEAQPLVDCLKNELEEVTR